MSSCIKCNSPQAPNSIYCYRCDLETTPVTKKELRKVKVKQNFSQAEKLKKKVATEKRIKKYGDRCFYCDVKLTTRNFSKDHLIPTALGGQNIDDNIVPACKKCNTAKGSIMPLTFLNITRK